MLKAAKYSNGRKWKATMLSMAARSCARVRVHSDQNTRLSLKQFRSCRALAAICLVELFSRPSSLNFINGYQSLLPQEERPRWQTMVSKRSYAHVLRLG